MKCTRSRDFRDQCDQCICLVACAAKQTKTSMFDTCRVPGPTMTRSGPAVMVS